MQGLQNLGAAQSELLLTCPQFVLLGSAVTEISLNGQLSMDNLVWFCYLGVLQT